MAAGGIASLTMALLPVTSGTSATMHGAGADSGSIDAPVSWPVVR